MPHRLLSLFALTLLAAAPLAAQQIDFGTDSSPWANDGECDDPRFQGAGMTQTPLLDSDIRADATDCRTAFDAGTISLIGAGAPPPVTPGGKTPPGQTPTTVVDGINFGDDSSQWAMDGECDDRRFIGTGMAGAVSWANVGRDATDCQTFYEAGTVRLWDWAEARAATQCAALSYGDDSGEYANDGECDDPRFEGPGTAFGLNPDLLMRDAGDCRRLCDFGIVALRDY